MTVECSQCGTDIAKFFAKADMGMCNTCGYLFCKNCIPKRCPTCKNKIVKTKRVKDYPQGWGPKHVVKHTKRSKGDPAVPCAQCGTDIAKFFAKADMGICENCQKVYCSKCLSGIKKRCPICKEKLTITKRTKELPSTWLENA